MKKRKLQDPAGIDHSRVFGRPGAYYWRGSESGEEYGPFETLLDAANDMQSGSLADLEPGETLEEAEDEIGIAAWIDPDTGAPAEESVPRLEEH